MNDAELDALLAEADKQIIWAQGYKRQKVPLSLATELVAAIRQLREERNIEREARIAANKGVADLASRLSYLFEGGYVSTEDGTFMFPDGEIYNAEPCEQFEQIKRERDAIYTQAERLRLSLLEIVRHIRPDNGVEPSDWEFWGLAVKAARKTLAETEEQHG